MMRSLSTQIYFLLLLIAQRFLPLQSMETFGYEIEFTGAISDSLKVSLIHHSQTASKKHLPLINLSILRKRAEEDIPTFLKILHSHAYYHARVSYLIEARTRPPKINFIISLGPPYLFQDVDVSFISSPPLFLEQYHVKQKYVYHLPFLNNLQGTLARARAIYEGEREIVKYLREHGYYKACVTSKRLLADPMKYSVHLTYFVDSGPVYHFGPTQWVGLKKTKKQFAEKKIAWKNKDPYDPRCIETTQSELEKTGLFTFVGISLQESEGAELPVCIDVMETKHKSLGGGIGYTTQKGPGIAGEWEDKNIRGLGEKISLQTNLFHRNQTLLLSYKKPDFRKANQNAAFFAKLERENTKSYETLSRSLSLHIEEQNIKNTQLSYGATLEDLRTEKSDNDGMYLLLKIPIQWKWTHTDQLFNPSKGVGYHLKLVPTQILVKKGESSKKELAHYLNHQFTGLFYYPLIPKRQIIFCAKATFGTIIGAKRAELPAPERFYSGSESTLRGYTYLTVSPLDQRNDPIGGKSLLIWSFETRLTFTKHLGAVLFYEIGNVYEKNFPKIHSKQLRSTGFGLRYHTPIGPLRIDIAFPIDRRRRLDRPFQMYFSIGQAF